MPPARLPRDFADIGKVLVVDDEHSLGNMLSDLLEQLHLQSDIANSVYKARKLIAQKQQGNEPYAAYILDNMMPDTSGLEYLQELREQGDLTPIILCSGQDVVVNGMENVVVLQKPVSMREIADALAALWHTPLPPHSH